MYKICYVWFLLVIQVLFCGAQTNYPIVFHTYDMQDGLSNNVVYDICQDENGCMWFGTAEGVSRFDGSEFLSFNWAQKFAKAEGCKALKILYHNNKIYSATPFGLVVYNMETESYRKFLPEGMGSMPVKALATSRDGNIWVAFYSGQGVYKFDVLKETFTYFSYTPTDGRIISLYEDKDGLLYVGTHFGGLDIVNLKTGQKVNSRDLNADWSGMQIETIMEDSYGYIWLGAWNGLAVYDKKNKILSAVHQPQLASCEINVLTEDKSGILWVGTETGLFSFHIREALDNHLANFPVNVYKETGDEYGLSYRTVLDIHCDRENNIWIATHSGGVNFISRFQSKFKRIVYDKRLQNSLSYRMITSVCEDSFGNLWMTTDGGGVNCYNKQTDRIKVYNSRNSRLKDDAVLCSLVDSDGDLWLGTYHHTLNYKPVGGSDFIVYEGTKDEPNSLLKGDVFDLTEDVYKRIWIGQRSGLVCFDKQKKKFIRIPELEWFSSRCLCASDTGIFIGGEPGIRYYDFAKHTVSTLHSEFDKLFANCLHADLKGNLWIGTNGQGLFRYNLKTAKLDNYTMLQGLPSDNICKILEDLEHNLWLTTTKGISKMNIKDLSIQNFNAKDGVQPGMFIGNSGMKSRSGEMFFGGTEGVTFFTPLEITEDKYVPNLIFTKFQLFNNTMSARSEGNRNSPLEKSINYVDEIELKYNESMFSIEYTSVDYRSTDQINYAYKLEGVDKDWNYVKNKKVATYRYISPGTYVFKVMASNLNGVFDMAHCRSIRIHIVPPFWLTWWAYIIYTILAGCVLYFIWRFLTVRSRALSKIKYERMARQKTEDFYQEKLVFFTNVSHELKTPLTLIAAPVDRLFNEETSHEKKYLLSLIKRNVARMLNNINQIMDIRKIDHNLMSLRVQEIDVIAFVKKVMDLFEDLARSKHIALEYSHQDDVIKGWFSTEFLDKILCNLLSNAFKYTLEHGDIIVDIFRMSDSGDKNDRLCIEVTDTGKGIPADNLPRIFDRFYQVESDKLGFAGTGSGVGLHLVKSLVEMHKGKITVSSKEGIGTKFVIVLPYHADNYTTEERMHSDQVYYHSSYRSNVTDGLDTVWKSEEEVQPQCNKLLIIDDNTEILNFLKLELSGNYEVVTAEGGQAGLEKAYEVNPDLIISDVMMPDVDGIQVCKELKTNIKTCHIPVILLTAKNTIDDRIEGLEVGADSYIPKPFDIRHLRVRIKKLIESRESIRRNYASQITNPPEEKPKGMSAIDDELLKKIIAYINDNLSDTELNGETIARQVAMSRMSLHRKLKALTGLSAGDFIRNIRLEKAKVMLESGGKTVSEVAYEVGYSSPSYFYTCFLRKYGVAPSDMIKKK